MKLTFIDKGIVMVDNAKITYKNFAGIGGKFNREGDRNFALIIDTEENAKLLTDEGWNVRVKPPRDEDDTPFMYLPVKIKFNARGPAIYLKTNTAMNRLDEESIACIDEIDILSVDMDLRPYDWEVNGKTGRTAYLQSMCVTQNIDRFAERYID